MNTDGRVTVSRLGTEMEALTEKIIGAALAVSSTLGHGFLEAVYQKALLHELRQRSLAAQSHASFRVHYKGLDVGCYYADLIVERSVIVELKTVRSLMPIHVGQVVNYLKASGLPVGLLFNFAKPKLEWRRVLFNEANWNQQTELTRMNTDEHG